jgi:hypothetical protein
VGVATLDFVKMNEIAVGHITRVIVVDSLLRCLDKPSVKVCDTILVGWVVVNRILLATRHTLQLLGVVTVQFGRMSGAPSLGCGTAFSVNGVFHSSLIITRMRNIDSAATQETAHYQSPPACRTVALLA